METSTLQPLPRGLSRSGPAYPRETQETKARMKAGEQACRAPFGSIKACESHTVQCELLTPFAQPRLFLGPPCSSIGPLVTRSEDDLGSGQGLKRGISRGPAQVLGGALDWKRAIDRFHVECLVYMHSV